METEGAEAIANDYKLTLADLNCNSKLHINVLTILAEENIKYAAAIVQTIMKHLETTPPESKLPILYLIDSIIKNVGSEYLKIFSQHIISIFASVFQKVDEPTRVLMYKLRQTWSNIFNNKILYGLDVKTKQVDPAWPITAEQPPAQSIHINPKFLGSNAAAASSSKTAQVSIIQKDDDVAKAEREAVLKQLLVKGVVEQKKRELNAKVSQKIESKPTSFVQFPPIQTIPAADPRSAAKLRALQADPRIVRVAPIKKPLVLPTSINVDVSSARTAAPVKAPVTVPSVVSVVKKKSNIPSEVKTTPKDVPNDRTKDDKVPESSSRNIEKRTENVLSAKNPVKLKGDTHISAVQKSDSYNNSSKDKNSSGKKKKKFGENKLAEKDKVPIANEAKTTISPRKSKEKNTEKKKINSREKKSSSRSPRSPVDDKKHPRQRSRSPIHKSEKKSLNRSSPKRHNSGRDTRLRKQSVDEEKRKLNFDLRNGKEEEDTDLRLRYTNSEVDRGKKVVKRESDEEKRETSGEPPEKKPREDKENDNDSILGATDQDYRIPPNQKSSEYKGWATYKAAHPEEFKMPLRQSRESIDSNQSVFDEYRNNSSNEKPYSKSPTESYNSPLTPQTEYDRLGRPRLYIRKMLQRSDSYGAYLRREEDFMRSPNSSHRQWHELFRRSDTTDILRQVEEKFQLGTISKADLDDIRQYFKYKDYSLHRQSPSGDDFKDLPYTRRSDLEFKDSPEHIPKKQHHPQQSDEGLIVQGPDVKPLPVADFRLDNQSRKVHFVDDKAFIVNDDNEPREITFQGSPTPVYIEGLKPILLQFDGKPVNFELDGRVCSMKFGVPFRELFINNYPYKGQFGGPPFLAMLDNRQVYRISLGGPTPKVEIGQQPAYELQQKFHAQNNNDVDFRHKSNTEKFNDMDWRHITQPSNAQHDQRPDNQSVNTESHSYEFYRPKSGFDEREFRSGPDNVYSKEHQKMQEWEPEYRPPTSQAVESVSPRLPDWTQPPPFRDVQMANSPRNTPPHDGPPHPNEWGPPPRPFTPNRVNPPNGPWVPENFGPSGPTHVRPPRPELVHNSQQEPPLQHYDRTHYPEYYDNTKGPFNFRNPSRPSFNTRQPSRMFNDKPILRPRLGPPPPLLFHRPPMQPWMRHPRMLHPTENRQTTLLPPPPQPPILRMPSSVIRPETSVSSASENTTVPMASVPGIPPIPAVPSLNAPSSFIQPAIVTPASSEAVPPVVIPAIAPIPAPNIDISTLFEKLLAAGVISKPTSEVPVLPEEPVDEIKKEDTESDKKEDSEKEPPEEVIPSIEMKLQCLKVKFPGVTNALYKGSQCASCGMRFKEIHGERYSRHLDWHFRMNRREKDGVKKAFSRKWYYEVEDWIQFEEFEDFEERARSFFELQADEQFQMEAAIELPSVPASGQEAESCVVCGEAFFLFWVEEEEEWHLRNAVRHDEQAYHPSCYEDFIKASREPETPVNKDDSIKSEGDIKEEADIKKEPLDDVEEVIANEEPLPSTPVIKTEDISSEIIETLEKLMEDVLLKEDSAGMEDVSLNEEAAESENVQASEESLEIKLEGKPGEEEVIGLISESDMETDVPPQEESEKVVFESGPIIMKVRAESLKPASPAPDNTTEKGASTKEVVEESEEEEFRPPTPDPRFQVLPPVQRGTELSGLCTIM